MTTTFSPRETEVLTYLAKGLTKPEIAKLIKCSPHTVGDYVRAIYKKLDVDNKVEAAVLACKMGLV